ncbi:hypothetical protein JCM8097_002444 [Rhodosporidiobolus ruineniae]
MATSAAGLVQPPSSSPATWRKAKERMDHLVPFIFLPSATASGQLPSDSRTPSGLDCKPQERAIVNNYGFTSLGDGEPLARALLDGLERWASSVDWSTSPFKDLACFNDPYGDGEPTYGVDENDLSHWAHRVLSGSAAALATFLGGKTSVVVGDRDAPRSGKTDFILTLLEDVPGGMFDSSMVELKVAHEIRDRAVISAIRNAALEQRHFLVAGATPPSPTGPPVSAPPLPSERPAADVADAAEAVRSLTIDEVINPRRRSPHLHSIPSPAPSPLAEASSTTVAASLPVSSSIATSSPASTSFPTPTGSPLPAPPLTSSASDLPRIYGFLDSNNNVVVLGETDLVGRLSRNVLSQLGTGLAARLDRYHRLTGDNTSDLDGLPLFILTQNTVLPTFLFGRKLLVAEPRGLGEGFRLLTMSFLWRQRHFVELVQRKARLFTSPRALLDSANEAAATAGKSRSGSATGGGASGASGPSGSSGSGSSSRAGGTRGKTEQEEVGERLPPRSGSSSSIELELDTSYSSIDSVPTSVDSAPDKHTCSTSSASSSSFDRPARPEASYTPFDVVTTSGVVLNCKPVSAHTPPPLPLASTASPSPKTASSRPPPSAAMSSPGKSPVPGLPARIELAHQVGHGASGSVWVDSSGTLAVKLLEIQPGDFVEQIAEPATEADYWAQSQAISVLVFDFVPGQSFKTWVSLAPYTDQVLAAIRALHSFGIIHRDIKPEHFLLSADKISIVDFGRSIRVKVSEPGLYDEEGMVEANLLYPLGADKYDDGVSFASERAE